MTITIILIIFSFWTLAKASEASQRKRAARRAEAERQRRQAEARAIIEEQKRADRERKEMARRQVEIDREMRRVVLEQERQRKEQERQAAVLRKHDEEIEKLKHRIEKAEADILFLQDDIVVLETLRQPKAAELHLLMNQKVKDDYNGINNPKRDAQIEKLTKTVRQYDKQIHAGMQKISDMENAKSAAERKMREVA